MAKTKLPKITWDEGAKQYGCVVPCIRNGKTAQKRMRNKDEAILQREVIAYLDDLTRHNVDNDKLTVEQWVNHWLTSKKKKAPNTYANYELQCRVHIIPKLGQTQIKKLTQDDLQKFFDALYEPGARKDSDKKKDKGLSARSVKDVHTALNGALLKAVKDKVIPDNPLIDVELKAVLKPEIRILTAEEVTKVRSKAQRIRFRSVIPIALGTGARRSELLGLRWSKVSLTDKEPHILITETRIRTSNGDHHDKQPTKNQKARRLPISALVVAEFKAHRKRQITETEKFIKANGKEAFTDGGYVFCTQDGQPLKHRYFDQAMRRIFDNAGLEDSSFHDFRHNYASYQISLGTPLKLLQELLGHAKLITTLDTYGHLVKGAGQDVASNMDFLMQGEIEEYKPKTRGKSKKKEA